MYSVSSNAVAQALSRKADVNAGIYQIYLTPRQVSDPSWLANFTHSIFDALGIGLILFSVGWEEYGSFPFAGAQGYLMRGLSSAQVYGQLRNYADPHFTYYTMGIDGGYNALSWVYG